MRVVHVAKFYAPDVGGMESFVRALAEEQVRQGHEVTVLCHGAWAEERQWHGVRLLRCPVLFSVAGCAPVSFSLLWRLFRLLIARQRPDIVHVHCPNTAALWVCCMPWVPFVVHWHSDVLFETTKEQPSTVLLYLWRLIERVFLRRARSIITTTQCYAESSATLAPYLKKCCSIPLALSEPSEPDTNSSACLFLHQKGVKHSLRLLFIGRFCTYKGLEYLLDAVAESPFVRLCLIGDGPLRPLMQRKVVMLGLQERVFFAGVLTDGQVRACLQTADVLVLPSIARTEAFGMVLLEAMREGKPCIASNVVGSGMTKVVEHTKTGLLVTPQSVLSLKDAFIQLQDTEKREEYGRNAKGRWNTEYSIADVVTRICDVYKCIK